MSDAFLEGDSVIINNFGTFEVKKKLERIIVNPATGQHMLVPPKLVLGFKQSDSWKTEMRNEGGRK
jgi:DNA-binding protein HU-beta/integration host factor subunit alpha